MKTLRNEWRGLIVLAIAVAVLVNIFNH